MVFTEGLVEEIPSETFAEKVSEVPEFDKVIELKLVVVPIGKCTFPLAVLRFSTFTVPVPLVTI